MKWRRGEAGRWGSFGRLIRRCILPTRQISLPIDKAKGKGRGGMMLCFVGFGLRETETGWRR